MSSGKLERMANQIADNFFFGNNRDAAVAGVLDHIRRFWTLDMKKDIVARVRDGRNAELNEVAAQAIAELAKDERYAA